jgi:hypothetical protein
MPQGPYTHERIHFGADADSTALASQTPPKKNLSSSQRRAIVWNIIRLCILHLCLLCVLKSTDLEFLRLLLLAG